MSRLHLPALHALQDTLARHVERGRLPGAVAAVLHGGQMQWQCAVGRRDAVAADAMREDTLFRIYSMTKPIVSLAALMLAEEGQLQLTDPVAHYLPAFGALRVQQGETTVPLRRPPTVHDLLRHTAGFSYEFLGDGPVQRLYREARITDPSRTSAELTAALAAIPLAFQPGSVWAYSLATDVLGLVLEVVSGQNLATLLQQRIFGPLKMKDTHFVVPPEQQHRIAEPLATCPDSGHRVRLHDPRLVPGHASGGGGLVSTLPDYVRFLQLLVHGGTLEGTRWISRATHAWMTADHIGTMPTDGDVLPPGHGFGLGFAVRTTAGMAPTPGSPGMYYWSGIGGTSFFIDPAQNIAAVFMAQAPNQRLYYRTLFRHMVYAAVD